MRTLVWLALLAPLDGASLQPSSTADPVVPVTGGQIRGRLLPAPGGATFKGIPFVQPPLGELRWREPQPVKPWAAIRKAEAFGPSCTQNNAVWNAQEYVGNQEDCLYLNVWTPEWPVRSKRPVMFFIHGGGNTTGASSVEYLDGASLIRRGVVLVSANYRLGLFGFFAHPELTRESPHGASGNYGLMDQIAALQWVRENISRFGGDPSNITVFGHSAGSGNIGLLMTSPLAKGLFHRAIQQSGTVVGRSRTRSLADSEEAGRKLAAKLDAPEQGAIAFLRRIPAGEMQRLAFPQERAAGVSGAGAGVGPNIDGWVLTRPAWEVFAAGWQHPVPLMIGNAAQEMRSRASPDELRRTITETYGDLAPKALALYGLAEPGSKGNDDPLYGNAGAQWGADVNYRCSIALTAEYHFLAGLTVYQYQFDRAIPGRPASEHAGELPYVFGNLLPAGFVGGPFGPDDRRISDEMQLYWTHFARKGDPNGKGVPQWPKFDPAARGYMEFTDKGPVAGQGLRRAFCELYLENAKRQFAKAK